jgi:hypothetical protein
MPGRRRDETPDTKLDELFGEVEPTGPGGGTVPGWRWVLRAAVQTFLVSAVAFTGLRLLGLAPSLPLILAVAGGAVLIRLAASSVREPRGRRPADLMRPSRHRAEPPPRVDGVVVAVRRWDRRLATTDSGLSASLGELADERLRQRHGITRASDPSRARALLGEPVWALLAAGTVTAAQAETAIRRLESM